MEKAYVVPILPARGGKRMTQDGALHATIDGIQLFDSINRDEIEVKTRNLIYHLFVGFTPPGPTLHPVIDLLTADPRKLVEYALGWFGDMINLET